MKTPRSLKPLAAALIAAAAAVSLAAPARKTDVANNLLLFNQLYKELNTFYVDSIDADNAIETAITAMLDEIDPYTEYIPEKSRADFETQTTGEYAGIGSYIMQRDGDVFISGPRPGSPAETAGLKTGDRIVAIDGDTVLATPSAEVSKRLKGTPGTTVRVDVWRPWAGADSALTFDIVRARIHEPSVSYAGVLPDSVGYIELRSFTEKSPEELRDALTAIKTFPGLKGLVLDLRGNAGGLVESAVKILGYFFPKNTEVLRTRGRGPLNEKIYKTAGKPVDTRMPLVILTDGGTASAAEIVTGAVQDLDRGVVVGTRSFGKGLVQSTRMLPFDNLLKVTVAKYYIPSGRLIQAIDYSRRNPDGSVARIPDSLTGVFHTAAGREVRDGGGITPDDTISSPDINRLVYNLVRDNWVFDYATRYAALNDSLPGGVDRFAVSDSLYADFKQTIDPSRLKYDRVCEMGLEALQRLAESEGYMNDSTRAAFDVMARLLRHDLNHDLDVNRSAVEPYLVGEIVGRYAGDAGRARAVLRFDPQMARAREILSDPALYRSFLTPTPKKER